LARVASTPVRTCKCTYSSIIIRKFKNNILEFSPIFYLLGGSGYPLRKYLKTPVEDAAENSQKPNREDLESRKGDGGVF
jgi:hypothetical protein